MTVTETSLSAHGGADSCEEVWEDLSFVFVGFGVVVGVGICEVVDTVGWGVAAAGSGSSPAPPMS
ncbi:MAG TPA: hypothetical protein VMT88_08140, partial [Actinomycetes bacterium]|nr:hypothetical protein [Actinomycetes bacterium]